MFNFHRLDGTLFSVPYEYGFYPLVPQEEPFGCAVACVASLLSHDYDTARDLFDEPHGGVLKGYSCGEICNVLNKYSKYKYVFKEYYEGACFDDQLEVVFLRPSLKYPFGHFMSRSSRSSSYSRFYMNPHVKGFGVVAEARYEEVNLDHVTWCIIKKYD